MVVQRFHVIATSICGVLGLGGLGTWYYYHTHPAQTAPAPIVEHIPVQAITEENVVYIPIDTPGEAKEDPQKAVDALADFHRKNPGAKITSHSVLPHGILLTWECTCP